MLRIKVGRTYIFRHCLKAAVRNENKKDINFVTICRNNSFTVSIRNIMSMIEEEDNNTQNIKNATFFTSNKIMKNNNWITKKKIEDFINNIDSINCIDIKHALLLLHLCSNLTDCLPLDKVKLGESLWTVLIICNFKINTAHYNALLKLYVENGYGFSPLELLKNMQKNKISANSTTYKMCINYYCTKGNTFMAYRLLNEMEKLGFHISESIFNSILLAYSLSGQTRNMAKILAKMKEQKLQLTSETYTTIMCAYAKTNDINQIREILETCNLRNVHFTNKHILNVIYALAANNHKTQIETIYQYLKKKNQILYNEIQVILKLLSINQIHIAINALLYMSLSNDHPQYEDIFKLILEHMINNGSLFCDIVYVCTFFKCEETLKKFSLISLYHSLTKNQYLSLSLLKLCKCHCVIKPHYFWPLLISHRDRYNLQGILDILETMINDFNVLPCVDTIADYVLPIIYGDMPYVRNLLMKYKINETIIDNAYVLLYLRREKLKEAVSYIRYFRGKYFYKILAHDLRQASVFSNNVRGFIYISCNLLEGMDLCSSLKENKESFVPIDRQLHEMMIEFPYYKSWLIKVICEIEKQNIKLKSETIETIHEYLNGYKTDRR
ncbi:unnamed protein product [Xylocopa violacea]|uniref:Pentatricopeptide repeat-containing protein n=1 Tax=Xylocopa violacea TaxID=135666 RepID=A0ABP1PEI4_XYLVO